MATLATMALARGLALGLTNASSIRVDSEIVNWLGQASVKSIPATIIPLLVTYVFFHNVMAKSIFGRHTYAVGGNISAARASGILTEKHVIQVYTLCGLMVGIGAIITVGRLTSAPVSYTHLVPLGIVALSVKVLLNEPDMPNAVHADVQVLGVR